MTYPSPTFMLRAGEAETVSIINKETRIEFRVNIADERRWPREGGSAEHFLSALFWMLRFGRAVHLEFFSE